MSSLSVPIESNSLSHYLNQIGQFSLLSRDEERNLASRYRQDQDLDAAHRLVCANLRFVVKIAYEYRNYGFKMLDIVQEGNIGLMMAVKKFDPERGNRFISYAVWWIRAYIHNFIITNWSLVKIGTTQAQKKLFFKLSQTKAALQQLTGRSDTTEVASQLSVTKEEVESMSQRLSSRDASMNMPLAEGEDYTLLQTLSDDRENQEEQLLRFEEESLRIAKVNEAIAHLNDREQNIVQKRILSEKPSTLRELAEEYGISRERVRQLEKAAMAKLKALLENSSEVSCDAP